MAKKRGASMSSCGHSSDHYQDIIRHDPAHILLILKLCNLIAIGTLTDGSSRTLLLNGKIMRLQLNTQPVFVPSVGRNSSLDFQQGTK